MAQQQASVEQCLITLTEIMARQSQPQNWRTVIEKQIKFMQPFNGEPGTLPSFIATVDQVMMEYGNNPELTFNIIYNEKITGAAKNYLATEVPATWDECKQKLKIHYRPTKDPNTINRDINNLKVCTISQLLDKIQEIVNHITECAAFNENGLDIASCLNSSLILRIKQITAGSLAADIYDKYSLSSIRTTLYKYVGQDKFNLQFEKTHTNPNKNTHQYYPHNNRHTTNNLNQHPNSRRYESGQVRQNYNQVHNQPNNPNRQHFNQVNNPPNRQNNNFRNSGQYRSGQSRAEPMDVDALGDAQDVNQIESHEFFIN